jgi:hypothetical protein
MRKIVVIQPKVYSCIQCDRIVRNFAIWEQKLARSYLNEDNILTPFCHIFNSIKNRLCRMFSKYIWSFKNIFWSLFPKHIWPHCFPFKTDLFFFLSNRSSFKVCFEMQALDAQLTRLRSHPSFNDFVKRRGYPKITSEHRSRGRKGWSNTTWSTHSSFHLFPFGRIAQFN